MGYNRMHEIKYILYEFLIIIFKVHIVQHRIIFDKHAVIQLKDKKYQDRLKMIETSKKLLILSLLYIKNILAYIR